MRNASCACGQNSGEIEMREFRRAAHRDQHACAVRSGLQFRERGAQLLRAIQFARASHLSPK